MTSKTININIRAEGATTGQLEQFKGQQKGGVVIQSLLSTSNYGALFYVMFDPLSAWSGMNCVNLGLDGITFRTAAVTKGLVGCNLLYAFNTVIGNLAIDTNATVLPPTTLNGRIGLAAWVNGADASNNYADHIEIVGYKDAFWTGACHVHINKLTIDWVTNGIKIAGGPYNGYIGTLDIQQVRNIIVIENTTGISNPFVINNLEVGDLTVGTGPTNYAYFIVDNGKSTAYITCFKATVSWSTNALTRPELAPAFILSNYSIVDLTFLPYQGQRMPVATLPANPPVSGVIYRNPNPFAIEINLPVYASSSSVDGTVTIGKGANSTALTTMTPIFVSGDTTSNASVIITAIIPAGWYYSFTGNNTTFGTAIVYDANQ